MRGGRKLRRLRWFLPPARDHGGSMPPRSRPCEHPLHEMSAAHPGRDAPALTLSLPRHRHPAEGGVRQYARAVADGFGGLTLIYELMLNTMAVSNIISEGKTFRLQSTMATSTKQGMCTFDQCMFDKYAAGLMTREAVLAEMRDPTLIAQVNMLWAKNEAQKAKAQKK